MIISIICLYTNIFFFCQVVDSRIKALTEIRHALSTINNDLPQLHMANVWVSTGECVTINTNWSCMDLAFSTNYYWKIMPTDSVHWIHIQPGKGMIGMVLASENKSCFCPNLSEFGIVDQPLSHYDMSARRDACFAICLQSPHTGHLLYVVEFFLCQGPATCKYVRSVLSLLLPIVMYELRSCKLACGKQLGEELVVEVIEFSYANKLDSSELEPASVYPVILKSVQYNHNEYHHTEEEQQYEYHHTDEEEEQNEYHHTDEEQQQYNEYHQYTAEQHGEECTAVGSDSNIEERKKRKNSFNLSFEVLKSHFGKKLKDVAKELGGEYKYNLWFNLLQN